MAKTIELLFENNEGKTVRYSLDNPVDPFDAEAVNAAMDEILTQNAFTSSGGDLVKKKEARIVERNVTDIPLS
ncbi:hypothetical protein JOD43_000729 [Pullulanibacillus pueri]|uniref:Potassium channel protein n=1 Tax=Pullulanibacillus pueri TaxID=1437324 RepID=A0A8J3A0E8_9BACL|nr:DUF2922 domain-containing protein [Pullulanibacillus pueri]MBM7680567.1 hypothetical protein [Pullulanibacillus pueri]GGH88698.1 potassium channel protein [Pullulanibacillus pueri]